MRGRRAVLLVLGSSFSFACSSPKSAPPPPEAALPSGPPQIRDGQGRAMVFHGLNVDNAAKSDPQRMPALTQAAAAHYANDWGFDFVRLLVFWDALEPQPGAIDSGYLDRVAERVAWLGAQGISVLLDMHQDVYASKFCCDGAPAWAIVDDGQPFQLQSLWSANYLQPAPTRAFDHFWDADGSHPELQQHYLEALGALAQRFAQDPNVVGYDVINEPFPGSDFDVTEALFRRTPDDGGTSKAFDEALLGTFYQHAIQSVRAVDTDHYVFFEPRYAAPANGSPSFLPKLTDPRNGEPHLVFAPHLYSTTVEASNAYGSDDPTISMWEAARTAERTALGVPIVMGEWGLAWSNTNAAAFVDQLVAMADHAGVGWCYWSADPSDASGWALEDANGNENPIADHVVLPYARRIAGDALAWSFDPAASVFDVSYADRAGTTGPTEVFIPARKYPNGWHVEVTPDAAGTWGTAWDATKNVVSVTVPATHAVHHVRVVPGSK